jgi:hypothetical protein
MIIDYTLGYFITQTILLIWFYSPFRISIGKIIFDKGMYTTEQFETYVLILSPFLGKLLSCYICFSFWTSLVVGSIGSFFLYDMEILIPAITALTYPSICYLYKAVIDKS